MVHVSELSHNYVRVPSEVVKVGDEVDVKVLEVDKRKKQIKLSIKALQNEPGEEEAAPRELPGRAEPRRKLKKLQLKKSSQTRPLWRSPCARQWIARKNASRKLPTASSAPR